MSARITNEQILSAYTETGSVWAAGKKLGMAGQTVHRRLRVIGVTVQGNGRAWTEDEEEELKRLVEARLTFFDIANRLDRTYAAISLRASRLRIGSQATSSVKRKRADYYPKLDMRRHIKSLRTGTLTLTKYVRQHGLKIGPFVRSFQTDFPAEWEEFCKTAYANVVPRECAYCGKQFYPSNGKQNYCTQLCGGRSRTDESYFGGRRRETIGLADGQCQLCGRTPERGLSSHHVFGKGNDPDNTTLIALCQGCHGVVTTLAMQPWAANPEKLQTLIQLGVARANGARYMAVGGEVDIYVCVELEVTKMGVDHVEVEA